MGSDDPLIARILTRLGRPRLLWAVLWGLSPLVAILLRRAAAQLPLAPGGLWAGYPGTRFMNGLLWSYVDLAVLLTLPFFLHQMAHVRSNLARLTRSTPAPVARPFRGIGAVRPVVILSIVISIIYLGQDLLRHGALWGTVLLAVYFVGDLPTANGIWFLFIIFLGLHRLGGMPLTLEPFEQDRGLGLRPFGRLAFWAFLPFPVLGFPLLLFGRVGTFDVILNLASLLAGTTLFFLSLIRLRGQLLRAKAQYLAWARSLYAEALAPVKAQGSRDVLRTQGPELMAAAEVERRALAIQEWPFDEGTLRTVAAITTSIAAAVVARVLLSRVGL